MLRPTSQIGFKYGAKMAARPNGTGTKPIESTSAASKGGGGLDCQRSSAANARIASAYHATSGAPLATNCGRGSASHQSIATHSESHSMLKQMTMGAE